MEEKLTEDQEVQELERIYKLKLEICHVNHKGQALCGAIFQYPNDIHRGSSQTDRCSGCGRKNCSECARINKIIKG